MEAIRLAYRLFNTAALSPADRTALYADMGIPPELIGNPTRTMGKEHVVIARATIVSVARYLTKAKDAAKIAVATLTSSSTTLSVTEQTAWYAAMGIAESDLMRGHDMDQLQRERLSRVYGMPVTENTCLLTQPGTLKFMKFLGWLEGWIDGPDDDVRLEPVADTDNT